MNQGVLKQDSPFLGFRPWVYSLRLGNLALVFGLFCLGIPQNNQWLLFAGVAGAMLGGNWHNDFTDQAADAINRPGTNPFVAVSKRMSLGLIGMAMLLPILTAWFWFPGMEAWALWIAPMLLVVYNLHAQHLPLVGNFLISFLIGLTVWLALRPDVEGRFAYWGFVWLAFWLNLAREWIKTMEDRAGDSVHKRNSGAWFGDYSLRWMSSLSVCMGLVGSLWLFDLKDAVVLGWYVAVGTAGLACILGIWRLSPKRASLVLKLYLAFGLSGLAFF